MVITTTSIFATSDGGMSWQHETDPFGDQELSSVTCYSTSDCLVVGEMDPSRLYKTDDGGVTWQIAYTPKGPILLGSISCASPQFCVLSAIPPDPFTWTAVLTSKDGGITWKQTSRIQLKTSMDNLSCVDTSCLAVGENTAYSDDGGSSWKVHSVPSGVNARSVSCSSNGHCAVTNATGSSPSVLLTTNGGRTWKGTGPKASEVQYPNGVSCPLDNHCVEVGVAQVEPSMGTAYFAHNLAAHSRWKSFVLGLPNQMDDVDCWSVSQCVAYGGTTGTDPRAIPSVDAFVTKNGWRTWHVVVPDEGST
jgi:photosystem II stability/assembly factor-like uncharacterized protein